MNRWLFLPLCLLVGCATYSSHVVFDKHDPNEVVIEAVTMALCHQEAAARCPNGYIVNYEQGAGAETVIPDHSHSLPSHRWNNTHQTRARLSFRCKTPITVDNK